VLDTPEGEVSPLSPVPIAADDPKVARPPAQPSSEPTGPQSPLPQPLGAAPEEKAPPEKQEPSRPKGTLTLVTTPESEVSTGGRKLGRTPLFNVPLTAGNHQLKLKGDDGVTHVFPVAIKAGQKTSYRLLLEDLPAKP
jgi:serine/threonine-protein kinase